MLYALGMSVPDPVFWFEIGRRSYAVVPPLELGRAKRTSRARHVVDRAAARRRASKSLGRPAGVVDAYLHVLRSKRINAVVVPNAFPVGTAEAFRRAGLDVSVEDGAFFPSRISKRKDELAAIARAQAAGERALDAALDVLRESRSRGGVLRRRGETVTAELLRSVIHVSLARDGCTGRHTIVAVGDQCVDPHDTGSGPVRRGQSVIFDIFPRETSSGYWADMTRTVVRGRASSALREIYAAVLAGQEHAFARIQGGCDTRPIHEGIVALFRDLGFRSGRIDGRNQGFFHGTGHGVGLDIHEPPSFGPRDDVLPTGAVVTVEPGLYYERIGGVRLEDMVLVTETGCENLTAAPKVLEI